jgi:cold shock protein
MAAEVDVRWLLANLGLFLVLVSDTAHMSQAGAVHEGPRAHFLVRRWPSPVEPFPDPELSGLSVGPFITGPFTPQRERRLVVRLTGTVKFFNSAKGFGFITPENGSKDVFVHATAVERAGLPMLNEGDRVTFTLEDDKKGRGKQAAELQKA